MRGTTTKRTVLERRYWIYFEISETVQTQVPGGDITVFGGVSMVGGTMEWWKCVIWPVQ